MTAAAPPSLRLGLIGDPVAHSLSPAIQQPALDALGVPARYELWPTPVADLPARIAGLRTADVLGANVTVPHKLAVMALIDEVAPLARRAGAVNTIVNRAGRLVGENTDVPGFAASLAAVCPDPGERPALILGAGGAARAVLLALEGLGVAALAVANRDPERARRFAADEGEVIDAESEVVLSRFAALVQPPEAEQLVDDLAAELRAGGREPAPDAGRG